MPDGVVVVDAEGLIVYANRRAEKITEGAMEIPPAMGTATAINFQPTGGGILMVSNADIRNNTGSGILASSGSGTAQVTVTDTASKTTPSASMRAITPTCGPPLRNGAATASRRISVRTEIIAGSQFISMKRHASERVTWQIRSPSPVRSTNAERSKRSSPS